jgi:ribosomal protein S18 acetylase RimI-like enzyme
MEIRRATLADAGTLSALNADVQRLHAIAFPHLFKQPEGDDFARSFMIEQLADEENYFYIAQINQQTVGYVFARLLDSPENPFMHAWKRIYIDQLSVKPAYQGKGCGRLLLEKVHQLAQENGIDTITLSCWAFNKKAQAFFKKQGFKTYLNRMWRVESKSGD